MHVFRDAGSGLICSLILLSLKVALHSQIRSCTVQILMGASNYTLAHLITLSPEARATVRPGAAALARIADTIHVPALVVAMADPEVIADVREALELIAVRVY